MVLNDPVPLLPRKKNKKNTPRSRLTLHTRACNTPGAHYSTSRTTRCSGTSPSAAPHPEHRTQAWCHLLSRGHRAENQQGGCSRAPVTWAQTQLRGRSQNPPCLAGFGGIKCFCGVTARQSKAKVHTETLTFIPRRHGLQISPPTLPQLSSKTHCLEGNFS